MYHLQIRTGRLRCRRVWLTLDVYVHQSGSLAHLRQARTVAGELRWPLPVHGSSVGVDQPDYRAQRLVSFPHPTM